MKDIVERLRWSSGEIYDDLKIEAADEIERLRTDSDTITVDDLKIGAHTARFEEDRQLQTGGSHGKGTPSKSLRASPKRRDELPSSSDIIDEDFTGGLASTDYLEKLRNGELS